MPPLARRRRRAARGATGPRTAVLLRGRADRAQGTPSQITLQRCELTDNTNVIFTQQADGITVQYNGIHDNHTHGFTCP